MGIHLRNGNTCPRHGVHLITPLLPKIHQLIDEHGDDAELRIVTFGEIVNLPWCLLPAVEEKDSGADPEPTGSQRKLGSIIAISVVPTLRALFTEESDQPLPVGNTDPRIVSMENPFSYRRDTSLVWTEGILSQELLHGANVTQIIQRGFNALQQELKHGCELLHIACHGKIETKNGMLSTTLLIPNREHGGGEKSEINLNELLQLRPQNQSNPDQFIPLCRAAVFTSCWAGQQPKYAAQTDQNSTYIIPQYSLTHVMSELGCRQVLAHLWQAHRDSAPDIVRCFTEEWLKQYHRNEGEVRAAVALRLAQQRYLEEVFSDKGKRARGLDHPAYWAGWIVYDCTSALEVTFPP